MPLPIAAEIHRWLAHHRKAGNEVHLFPVWHKAIIFAPKPFLVNSATDKALRYGDECQLLRDGCG